MISTMMMKMMIIMMMMKNDDNDHHHHPHHKCHYVRDEDEGDCVFSSGTDYKRVCYFAGWSTKRQNSAARFDLDNLDPFLCTHIVYAFANIDVAKLTLIPAEWDDESTTKNAGSFERLNGLKSKNKGLKTLLSIGGAHAGSTAFEAVVKTPASIRTFVRNALQYVKSWGFDGIDIDWEYPSVKVRHSFTNLLKVGLLHYSHPFPVPGAGR